MRLGLNLDSEFDGVERVANQSAERSSNGRSEDINERRRDSSQ